MKILYKFVAKIEIFVKNRYFLSKIDSFDKNRCFLSNIDNFGQKLVQFVEICVSKRNFLSKIQICVKNRKFCQKNLSGVSQLIGVPGSFVLILSMFVAFGFDRRRRRIFHRRASFYARRVKNNFRFFEKFSF